MTFLFTDVEGSTRLWEAQPESMPAALAAHDRVLRSVVAAHGGFVFATGGDGFAVAFSSASEAVTAAGEAQRRLADTSWPDATVLRVRMGLHTGTADERGGDYFGPAVNRAARLMSAGHGGQILVSATTAALVGERGLVDLGVHRLKDLTAPERIFQLGTVRNPALRTLDRQSHNLPVQRGELFGREAQLRRLADALAVDRLVTVTGLGGAGKTRLALAVAAMVVERFTDGVWLVDLVPVDEPARVPIAIAEAIGLRLNAGRSVMDSLRAELTDRRTLLVLDNCEHLTDAVADVVDELLDATGEVRVLATSREPLEVPDERVFPLPALDTGAGWSPAAALFVARADRAGVHVGDDELDTVAEICRRLDGLPLAIELAAAQIAHLTSRQLLQRLDRRFELLAAGRGRRHQRQSSLETVIASTWALLDAQERALLERLAVFPGTFDVDAVEGVCTSTDLPAPVSTLRRLVGRSLVVHAAGEGGPGYRLLETVKLFAQRQLGVEAEQTARDRHCSWFLSRVPTSRDELYTSTRFAGWYGHNYENLRSASRHAERSGRVDDAARLVAAGALYWHLTSNRAVDGVHRIDEQLALDVSPARRAELHLAAALAGMGARAPERIAAHSHLALAHAVAAGLHEVEAMASFVASWVPALRDADQGLDNLARAERAASAAGALRIATVITTYRAVYAGLAGRLDEAVELAMPLIGGFGGDPDYSSQSALVTVWAGTILDEPEVALDAVQAVGRQNEDAGLPGFWMITLMEACAEAAAGRLPAASRLLTEAVGLARRQGSDDGLPDLLLAPAVAARRMGDLPRSAGLVRAIRDAGRPTLAFPITTAYRELRRRLRGLDAEPMGMDLGSVLRSSQEWLAAAH